ncbi:hypothetical protein E2C01_042335 [Portunus trituberculatus]|uniref:Uncharacterized protein n=1 Tax=Portunus trituberculatus TaxID=210409 RepID=A0A5B7FLJ9_PORTR|nr:hypothetical protein [Portunus trituberculatus]
MRKKKKGLNYHSQGGLTSSLPRLPSCPAWPAWGGRSLVEEEAAALDLPPIREARVDDGSGGPTLLVL